uniref:HERV-H LTR-associating 1 n=1 Tax=Junco hyemalis TaxID=40217 RepID=A0A8C5JG12_JUNHY
MVKGTAGRHEFWVTILLLLYLLFPRLISMVEFYFPISGFWYAPNMHNLLILVFLFRQISSRHEQWLHSCFLVPSRTPFTPFLSELPAKSLDLAAINLTELVNGMLSTALRGTKKLFSLLSITSYSSFAFHKVSVTIYNISNAKNIDPGKFPMHHCYCVNNVTNDLTDFTALLVDIIGNSTSYLTEIFKSTSILSVRQSNDSDCIYICVMAGQTGKRKNLSDFLEILDKSPVINYTFSSNTSSDLGKYILGNERKQEPQCPFSVSLSSPATRTPLAQKGAEIRTVPTTRFPLWPRTAGAKGSWFPPPHVDAPRPQGMARPPLALSPINPCVMELCRFFQLCLCVGHRRYSRKEAMRYCVEYYSWFVKNASYVCERVQRVAYSHTLKQKCLKNICTTV